MENKYDRILKWIIFGTFGFLFVLAILGLIRGLAYGQEIEFKITPNPAHPGDLILVEVKGMNKDNWIEEKLSVNTAKIKLFPYKDRVIGLVGIPLTQTVRQLIMYISVYNSKHDYSYLRNYELKVEPKDWPERRVVETAPLSPKKLARYLKEKALIKKALETTVDAPLWQQSFRFPFEKEEETSPFGQKRIGPTKTRQHRGVDLRAPTGMPVRSMNSGRVVLTGNFLADGKIVIVDHGLSLHTIYLHLSRIKIKKGQMVKRGQVLGLSGDTGFSEGPHLHLEVRLNGEAIDPLQILDILK